MAEIYQNTEGYLFIFSQSEIEILINAGFMSAPVGDAQTQLGEMFSPQDISSVLEKYGIQIEKRETADE